VVEKSVERDVLAMTVLHSTSFVFSQEQHAIAKLEVNKTCGLAGRVSSSRVLVWSATCPVLWCLTLAIPLHI
jgi:hypothetical protein